MYRPALGTLGNADESKNGADHFGIDGRFREDEVAYARSKFELIEDPYLAYALDTKDQVIQVDSESFIPARLAHFGRHFLRLYLRSCLQIQHGLPNSKVEIAKEIRR